jgi:pimeloyl-ACP methyl ester carboxylesterase
MVWEETMIVSKNIQGIRIACWMSSEAFDENKKSILFIHGSGGDHTVWVHQYSKMKDNYNIAAVDLPGHGGSEGKGESDVQTYVEWIKRIMDAFDIRYPYLAGHSLGAAITLSFAIAHPGLISGIIPVGGGVRMPVNPSILEGLKNDPASVIDMIVKFSIAKGNRERLGGPLKESMLKADNTVFHDDLVACDRLDITDKIPGIKLPTFVVCGDDDKMTPPSLSRYIADNISSARLSLIPGSGHFVMVENPGAFNDALKSFLD